MGVSKINNKRKRDMCERRMKMKRITLEIPDGFDEILTFTCIGNIKKCVNASINAIEIENHNGDTYVIRTAPGTASEWVKGENENDD